MRKRRDLIRSSLHSEGKSGGLPICQEKTLSRRGSNSLDFTLFYS
jgi:hypothetical protein